MSKSYGHGNFREDEEIRMAGFNYPKQIIQIMNRNDIATMPNDLTGMWLSPVRLDQLLTQYNGDVDATIDFMINQKILQKVSNIIIGNRMFSIKETGEIDLEGVIELPDEIFKKNIDNINNIIDIVEDPIKKRM